MKIFYDTFLFKIQKVKVNFEPKKLNFSVRHNNQRSQKQNKALNKKRQHTRNLFVNIYENRICLLEAPWWNETEMN